MTVRELIARLREFDGDLRVVRDCEDFMLYVKTVDFVVDGDETREHGADEADSDLRWPGVVLIS
ncbi:MAG TPA: hypothetical protein VMF13_08065 [Luteitalea sp.]|nr:hypothetical protein [Luteitalea sp.]